MCTIFVGVNQNREYPLVIIGNRDEFTDRPSMHASFWEKYPHILAGKDLKEGGTWMGITKHGYFAA
ncbi:NRDE family protein, partial [bacterium]|nr:NRDE family protein [bacterium]